MLGGARDGGHAEAAGVEDLEIDRGHAAEAGVARDAEIAAEISPGNFWGRLARLPPAGFHTVCRGAGAPPL